MQPPHELLAEVATSWCREADQRLWRGYGAAKRGAGPASGLVFPQKRDGLVRVSEQEARFAFASVLDAFEPCGDIKEVNYAVEVPTRQRYTFEGSGRSASTDLAAFVATSYGAVTLNIEFKAGGYSRGRARSETKVDPIGKDIAKLVAEPVGVAVWFHLLQNADSQTVPQVVHVLSEAISSLVDPVGLRRYTAETPEVAETRLVVHLCVLEQHLAFNTTVRAVIDAPFLGLAEPACETCRGRLIVKDARGWDVFSE